MESSGWVNQQARSVWISLGRADGLQRQMTFSVYPSTAMDVGKAPRKGSIEVTEILGDHLAEARILEDNPSDPIMPGDLIHTPVWEAGQRPRFALADGMDIDGDGKSDLDIVLNIIRSNGGIVDCYIDDEDNKTGEITSETRSPGAQVPSRMKTASEARRKARYRAVTLRRRLRIDKDLSPELLNRMGWRIQTPVIRYGAAAESRGLPEPASLLGCRREFRTDPLVSCSSREPHRDRAVDRLELRRAMQRGLEIGACTSHPAWGVHTAYLVNFERVRAASPVT